MRDASNLDYSGAEFYRLIQEVEGQGGSHLNLLHEPHPIDIPRQRDGGAAQKGLTSTGCNDATLFDIPFENAIFGGDTSTDQQVNIGAQKDGKPAHMAMPVDEKDDTIIVCALDDAVGLWPRFAGTWEEELEE